MSRSARANRKGSSYNEGRTSRASSGIVEDYSSRPDTASAKQRDRIRISVAQTDTEAIHSRNERSKSVPMSIRLPGRISPGCQGRMSAREFLQSSGTDGKRADDRFTGNMTEFKQESNVSSDTPWYVTMLREKEDRILQMSDEISRLSITENETRQKDDQIVELRRQLTQIAMARTNQENLTDSIIADLKTRIQLLGDEIVRIGAFEEESKKKEEFINELKHRIEIMDREKHIEPVRQVIIEEPVAEVTMTSIDARSTDFSDRMTDVMSENCDTKDPFERKVESLRASVRNAVADADALRDDFDNLVPEKLTPEDEVILIKDELIKKTKQVESLEQKLVESHKELILNEGFIQALQRDLQNSDNKVMKLMTQIDKSEKKMNEAIAESKAMSKKFSDLRESRKHNDIIATNEHELNVTKEALRESQNRIEKMKARMEKQSKEVRECHKKVRRANDLDKKQSEEIKNLCRDLEDIRHREQLSRVTAEQSVSRFERLRSRIIQAVYITPGAAIPDSCINDAVVFNAVKKIIEDRSAFHQKILETHSDFPPLQIELDATLESEKVDDVGLTSTANTERKSGKGGRKSPKHR